MGVYGLRRMDGLGYVLEDAEADYCEQASYGSYGDPFAGVRK